MKIKVLPAFNGDSIIISFESTSGIKNILIDGGIGKTVLTLKKELNRIQSIGQSIDLLVVTHTDDDHIGGILKIIGSSSSEKNCIKRVWFNSGTSISTYFDNIPNDSREVKCALDSQLTISVKQGNTLEKLLSQMSIWNGELIHNDLTEIKFHDAVINIISPSIQNLKQLNKNWETEFDKPANVSAKKSDYGLDIEELSKAKLPDEDSTLPNGSSIAFIIKVNGFTTVWLADSHPTTVVSALKAMGYSNENPLLADIIKISHHGSSKNINEELLNILKSKKIIVSTNGSNNNLPNKQCLAKIITSNDPGVHLYFNYPLDKEKAIFSKIDKKMYNFSAIDLSIQKMAYEIILQ